MRAKDQRLQRAYNQADREGNLRNLSAQYCADMNVVEQPISTQYCVDMNVVDQPISKDVILVAQATKKKL